MIKNLKSAEKALKVIGAEEIESYVLVNNYGCTFKIGDREYDTRFWANCYGAAFNEWITSTCGRKSDEVDKSIKIMVDYVMNTSDIDESIEVL